VNENVDELILWLKRRGGANKKKRERKKGMKCNRE